MRSGTCVLLLGLALCACGRTEAPEIPRAATLVVLCQVPSVPRDAGAQEAYPAGSRVVVADLAHPDRPPRVLSAGFHAAGEAAVSHDGKRVCFVGRKAKTPLHCWDVYACALEGGTPERITSARKTCLSPEWLPDGRIVYCDETSAAPHPASRVSAWALYVTPAGGGPSDRITFSGTVEMHPSVLSDGRVVYAGWRAGPPDDPANGGFALYTVHPDGTGVTLFHGGDAGVRYGRPRQGPGGEVYSVRRVGEGPGHVAVVDWRAPLEEARRLQGPTGVIAVEPAADGSLLVVTREGASGPTVLQRLASDGTLLEGPLFDDPAWQTVLAVDAAPRPRPQGHLSTIDVRKELGSLLAVHTDAEGVDGAVRVRVRSWEREYEDEPATLRDVGQVPLAEDGSFFVRVPADVPLVLELLDEAGRTLKASRTPFWVRPREIRGCTGCHDTADVTPPNRRPLAATRDPVVLRGADGEEGGR